MNHRKNATVLLTLLGLTLWALFGMDPVGETVGAVVPSWNLSSQGFLMGAIFLGFVFAYLLILLIREAAE
ncbi:hypothetical protein GOV11_03005 [Candidatus Woesearchaeota archaeon]|nr:hypothetical protein [Candidatus Woesearchaeota archaeon]